MSGAPLGSASGYLTALFRGGTLSSTSDSELLEQFIGARSGEDERAELAFSVLLARHGAMVLRVCRSVLGDDHQAEDAFQATFLILASRANSIRRQVSVASWLYGVALRVAATERSRAARRKRHERRRAAMVPESTTCLPPDDGEAVRALHQEIGLLPERYRSAVVLCYLEGLTHETAAERLGRPVGTVRSRLATARDRLRARLTRRGLAPAVVSAVPFSDAVPTVVPAALEEATVRASLHVVVGTTALAGLASAEAIALMHGTLRTMMLARRVLGLASVVAAGFMTLGAGAMAYSALTREDGPPPGRLADAAKPVRDVGGQEKAPGESPSPAPASREVGRSPRTGGADQAKSQGLFVIEAQTVDSKGKPLSGVDLGLSLSYSIGSGNEAKSRIERAMSDSRGQGRLEVALNRPGERAMNGHLWAYQSGRGLAASSSIPISEKSPEAPVRLVLEDPVKRTITVLEPGGKPIEGLHLVPRALQRGTSRNVVSPPEEWSERLTVTTDAKGTATIPYLAAMTPLSVRVSGPGLSRQTVQVPEQQGKDQYVLKLGPTGGRLVGIVRDESGRALADVAVEVWVRASGTMPTGVGIPRGRRRATQTEVIRFDSEALRTGPEGAFRTPPTLLGGSTYRVSIRREGFARFVSDWVMLDGERTTVPPIRLRSLRKLTGFVRDRESGPVGGARVFLPSGGPATTSDAEGRFELDGIVPDKTIVLVQRPGFRLEGWAVDPAATAEQLSLSLARSSEEPERPIAPLAGPLSDDESRALAKRVLEPYLRRVTEKGSDIEKLAPLLAVVEVDPDRVHEMLNEGQIKEPRAVATLRGELAVQILHQDAAEALALVEAIGDLRTGGHYLVRLATALPRSEREHGRTLLAQAVVQMRTVPQIHMKLNLLGQIIKGMLDLGAIETAKPLVTEGLSIMDSQRMGPGPFVDGFLAQVARIDPEGALVRIGKMTDKAGRENCYGQAAVELALSHPAEAERFFGLSNQPLGFTTHWTAMRLCRRLAKVEPPRARRIAAAVQYPGSRACAWAFVALGLSESDKQAARLALDRSLEEIDRIREFGPGLERVTNLDGVQTLYPTNPAVVILPVVELAAPERLGDFFWRAVALHDRVDIDREGALQRSGIGFECMLLSHYDREVAAALFEPMDSFIKSVLAQKAQSDELTASVLVAKACIDLKAGVELLDALPVARELAGGDASNEARMYLARAFCLPAAERWKRLWRTMSAQLPLEDE